MALLSERSGESGVLELVDDDEAEWVGGVRCNDAIGCGRERGCRAEHKVAAVPAEPAKESDLGKAIDGPHDHRPSIERGDEACRGEVVEEGQDDAVCTVSGVRRRRRTGRQTEALRDERRNAAERLSRILRDGAESSTESMLPSRIAARDLVQNRVVPISTAHRPQSRRRRVALAEGCHSSDQDRCDEAGGRADPRDVMQEVGC